VADADVVGVGDVDVAEEGLAIRAAPLRHVAAGAAERIEASRGGGVADGATAGRLFAQMALSPVTE